jgi:hypothetical protein
VKIYYKGSILTYKAKQYTKKEAVVFIIGAYVFINLKNILKQANSPDIGLSRPLVFLLYGKEGSRNILCSKPTTLAAVAAKAPC